MIRCVVHREKSAQGPGCVGLVLGFITDVYMPLLLPLDCSSIYQPNVNKADCLVSAV